MSRRKCCRCDDTNLSMALHDYNGNFERGWCEECWDNVIEEQKMEESK